MSKEFFDTVFENFKDGIMISDSQGKIIYVNDSYCRMSMQPRENILGKECFEMEKIGITMFGQRALSYALKTKKRIEEIIESPDDENIKYNVTGLPLFDENNQMIYVIVGAISLANVNTLQRNLTEVGRENIREAVRTSNLMCSEEDGNDIIAESKSMRAVVSLALQVAPTDVSILITGDSGTGKEVVAELIYQNSHRKGHPFVKINCSAIPSNLLETELFGYEEGAFTGAMKGGKPGLFEVANGGTVFLDEIGDMPLELQPKILRLIQTKEIMRVGGRKTIPLDIRLISATNKNLPAAIVNKEFREDLYYRINIVPITLLPLRERREDIVPLILYFFKKYSKHYQKEMDITDTALALLCRYDWPGNIRELKNIIERTVVMNVTGTIDSDLVCLVLGIQKHEIWEGGEQEEAVCTSLYSELEKLERQLILGALNRNESKRKAAKELGIDHSTLIKKCKKYGF
ncbi:MAG: sigma-54 interaction domain-containing protein [Anaerovoracaceae bacterium]